MQTNRNKTTQVYIYSGIMESLRLTSKAAADVEAVLTSPTWVNAVSDVQVIYVKSIILTNGRVKCCQSMVGTGAAHSVA
jgi:hypothetical protein